MSESEKDWADEEAERYLGLWNPRFNIYRSQDPAFRQDDVDRLAAALRNRNVWARAEGYKKGVEDAVQAVHQYRTPEIHLRADIANVVSALIPAQKEQADEQQDAG